MRIQWELIYQKATWTTLINSVEYMTIGKQYNDRSESTKECKTYGDDDVGLNVFRRRADTLGTIHYGAQMFNFCGTNINI